MSLETLWALIKANTRREIQLDQPDKSGDIVRNACSNASADRILARGSSSSSAEKYASSGSSSSLSGSDFVSCDGDCSTSSCSLLMLVSFETTTGTFVSVAARRASWECVTLAAE